jgi:DNA polymerase I-like protein with 3'-5' exonuclease and polymerase domains
MIQKKYTIVQNTQQLEAVKNHINSFSYFGFDTETTGLNVRKDKVIGMSICGEIGTSFYLPLFTWDKNEQKLERVWDDETFVDILSLLLKKELLMWNASFDVRVVKNNFRVDLRDSLLADVMLMKHTVQEEGEFGLKECAVELGPEIGLGEDENPANEEQIALKANVLANGGAWVGGNKEMYKADLDVLGLYACADADMTLRLAEFYKLKLEKEGLEEFFYDKEVMPLYKEVTITMEEKGVKLDMPKILSTKESIEKDMSDLERAILSEIMGTPEAKKWKKEKALEYYPPSPKGKFASKLLSINSIPLEKTEKGAYSFTKKAISKLPESPYKEFLEGRSALSQEELESVSQALFDELEELNINSKKQLGEIVFDYMKIKPLGKTDKGSPQFDDDFIQHLAEKHEIGWAKKLSSYNKLVKIKGTYIERFLEAQEDGFYYFSYKQHGTISGRYSGDAQQMPRPKEEEELDPIVLKYNNEIRTFFIAEEGRVFIDDDYESLEPHTFAHVSGDEGLRDIFRKGHDFYSSIAIPTEGLFQYSADKKADNYLGKKAKPKRQSAKAYALGVPYGMSDYALGLTLGVSTQEAAKLIEGYLGGFPELKKWMENTKKFVVTNGYIRSQAGRIRHLPRAKELFEKHGDKLLDWKYRSSLIKKHTERLGKHEAEKAVKNAYRDYKNSVNNGYNFQIQSLGASIVNAACIAITREFRAKGIDGYVSAQIHDQAIFNVPVERVEECKEIVQRLMENTTKLSLQLKAVPVVAKNWRDGH